jgi:hypothetical protein
MKKLLGILLVLGLFGCSHKYVRSWQQGEVQTCCHGIWCTQDKREQLAQESCGTLNVTAKSGQIIESGGNGYQSRDGSVSYAVSYDTCTTYRCGHY